MEKSVSTHVPARCRPRRASRSAKGALICPALEGVNVNVANVPATRQETAGCMGRRASVMIAAVKTWTVWSVEATARVPAAAASARGDGLESSASTPGSAT